MKTDTWTKIVLTVIAACLVLLVIGNGSIIPTAHANNSNKFVSVPINEDGSINVKVIKETPADVVIAGWREEPGSPGIMKLGMAPLPTD